jgi:hypothetical protein
VNDSIGTLEAGAGLGAELWRGTSRSLAETLIPQIPGAESAAARLARRLLLTSARPPEGAGGAIHHLRAERLLALAIRRGGRQGAGAGGTLDGASAGRPADAWLRPEVGRACALPQIAALLPIRKAAAAVLRPMQAIDRAWFFMT